MKKRIASAAVAAAMLGGAGIGSIAATPLQAFAQDNNASEQATPKPEHAPGQWMKDALSGLVSNGTINQQQSDAVSKALEDARPEPGPGGPHGERGMHGPGMEAAAKALGISESDMRTSLKDGKTIAALAQEKGVDVQKVIDAIVAERTSRIDERLAAGEITQERANQEKADLTTRVTEMVNTAPPAGGPRHDGRGPEGPASGAPAPQPAA